MGVRRRWAAVRGRRGRCRPRRFQACASSSWQCRLLRLENSSDPTQGAGSGRRRDTDARRPGRAGRSRSRPSRSPIGPRRSWRRVGLRRFAGARSLVKHAGLAPREKLSGTFTGRTKLTGQGRPGLGLAVDARWGSPAGRGLRREASTPDRPR
ncbi:MAG: transposase [Jiangellaceae bacterium]